MKILSLVNRFYLIFVVLWYPVRTYYLKFDAANRSIAFLTILIFFLNVRARSFRIVISDKRIKVWFIWVIYTSSHCFLVGSASMKEQGIVISVLLWVVHPMIVMLVVCFEYLKDERGIIRLLTFTLAGFLLVHLLNSGLGARDELRGERFFANGEAVTAAILVMIAALGWIKGHLTSKGALIVVSLSLFVIVAIATRKAFFASGLILVVVLILKSTSRSSYRLTSIIVLISGLFAFTYVLDSTSVGDRIRYTFEEGDRYNESSLLLLNTLGDRAGWYSTAFEYLEINPIFGLGLNNHLEYSNSRYRIHSEILVQSIELGLIGFILWAFFNYLFMSALFKIKGSNRLLFYIWCALISFSFTTWMYQFEKYYIVYGLLIGAIIQYENRHTLRVR